MNFKLDVCKISIHGDNSPLFNNKSSYTDIEGVSQWAFPILRVDYGILYKDYYTLAIL